MLEFKTTMWIICCLITMAFIHLTKSAGSPVSVFSQTGGSVTLEFQQLQPLESNIVSIQWQFDSVKIMLYVPSSKDPQVYTHKGRVVFNKMTFSLELKNLQKNDSGLYRGEINAGQNDIKVEYRLSVQDPVQAPVLLVVSNWSSSDFCNATVTCQSGDLNLTSTCNSSICSPESFRDTRDTTLTLSVKGGRIICNHSNPVSWSNDTTEIKPLCSFNQEKNMTPKHPTVLVLVLVLVLVSAVILVFVGWRLRRFSAALSPIRTENEEVGGASPNSGPQDKSIYSSVQPPSKSTSKPQTLSSPQSDTVYSMVNCSNPVSAVNPIYSPMQQRPPMTSVDHTPPPSSPSSLYAIVNTHVKNQSSSSDMNKFVGTLAQKEEPTVFSDIT